MALATRNLYLILKGRDEASRVVRGFGKELMATGRLARAEALRMQAAQHRERAAYLASTGASEAMIAGQKRLEQQYKRQAQELERAHRAHIRFTNALHTVSATLVTVGAGLTFAGAGVLAFMYKNVEVAQEYERQTRMTLTQVTDFKTSVEELGAIGLKVAKNIAVPFEQIQPALYDIFSSTNANLKEATILLEGFAKTAVAGQVTLQEASRGTVPILNAFNIPLSNVNEVLDIQFQLVRKGVGTYGEFSKVFGRVIPSATRAGQNFETVAAMLAYLTRNGLSAAMASTSAARALEAMTHPKSIAAMEKLGIKVRDAKGNFLPLEQSLSNLRKHLEKMPSSERVAALVDIFRGAGGTIQARRFLEQVLLKPGELEEFKGFLKDMENSTGAFDGAYETMSKSVASATELLRNKFKVLQESLGRFATPAFLVIIGLLQRMLDWFNNLSPETQKWIALGLVLGGVLGILGGIIIIVLGGLAGLFAAIAAAGATFFYLIGAVLLIVGALSAFGTFIVLLWNKSKGFRDFLTTLKEKFLEVYREAILPVAQGIKKSFEEKMLPALKKLWELFDTKVMPVLQDFYQMYIDKLKPAILELGNTLKEILTKAWENAAWVINNIVVPAIEWATKFYNDHKETIDQVVGVLVWLGKWVLKIGLIFMAVFGGSVIATIVVMILLFVGALVLVGIIITWVVDKLKWIWHWLEDNVPKAWDSATNAVKNAINTIMTHITGLKDKVVTFFKDAKQWLVDAGKNLLQGLIDGVKNAIPGLGTVMDKAAQFVKDHFPHSPAKIGPLAGAGGMFYAGQNLVKQLQQGINSMRAGVAAVSARTAGVYGNSVLGSPYSGRTVTQTFNISTQEMSPRRMSAELGFQLAGRY